LIKTGEGETIEYGGGEASRRGLHCAEDYTDLEIMRVLKDEVLNNGIQVLEHSPAVELLIDPDRETQ